MFSVFNDVRDYLRDAEFQLRETNHKGSRGHPTIQKMLCGDTATEDVKDFHLRLVYFLRGHYETLSQLFSIGGQNRDVLWRLERKKSNVDCEGVRAITLVVFGGEGYNGLALDVDWTGSTSAPDCGREFSRE